MAVDRRNIVVLNTHAQLQISLLMRFLSLLHLASQCAFDDGVCQLFIQQFFSLFAQFKTTTKSHENYVFLHPFSSMAISPWNNEKTVFYTGKLYGLTGMVMPYLWLILACMLSWICLQMFQCHGINAPTFIIPPSPLSPWYYSEDLFKIKKIANFWIEPNIKRGSTTTFSDF